MRKTYTKSILIGLLVLLFATSTGVVYANEDPPPVEPTQEKDSSDQPRNGSIDPNYKPSPKELALQKAKQKALK
ncbi:MAG: hypothetical protein KGY46_10605, partial [Anaerolineales bacterium]|nr:hypothetical protein [Anaerolineales bacterium]